MSAPFMLQEHLNGDVLVLKPRGRLDSLSSPVIEKKVFGSIGNGQRRVVMDLSEISYVNSAGLRMFLSVKKHMHALGGKFVLCNLLPDVMEVVKMCGFDTVLDLCFSEEEAMRKF